jgi:HCO3- transporter family
MANVKTVSGVSAVAQVVEEVVVVVVVELPRADLLPGSDEEGEVEVEKEPQTDQIDCDSEGPSEVQAEPVAKGVQGGTSVTSEVFSDVIETRLTGFIIHASILSSLLLLPSLGNIPIPVISGIFLYLGKKMMKGNLFLERLGNIIIEKPLLPKNNIFNLLPTATVLKYLLIQSLMLMLIWVMKQNKNFSLFFPSCIAFLMIVRSYVMPNFFSKTELELLDPEM